MVYHAFVLAAAISLATPVFAGSIPFAWAPPSGMEPGSVEGSLAVYATNPDGISVHLETSGLQSGHAVTVWLVAIQAPENCDARPCSPSDAMGKADIMNTVATNAGGAVVGQDGSIRITAFIADGEVPGNFFDTILETPKTAEVHLVVRDHGPLITSRAAEMLTTYRDGCTDDSIPPFYPDTARADGTRGSYLCKVVQFSVLQQHPDEPERGYCSPWPLCDWLIAAPL